jgi:hypothetical protein
MNQPKVNGLLVAMVVRRTKLDRKKTYCHISQTPRPGWSGLLLAFLRLGALAWDVNLNPARNGRLTDCLEHFERFFRSVPVMLSVHQQLDATFPALLVEQLKKSASRSQT